MNQSKNITISVKVNEREAAALRALAGGTRPSPGKGLRWLIDKYLHLGSKS